MRIERETSLMKAASHSSSLTNTTGYYELENLTCALVGSNTRSHDTT